MADVLTAMIKAHEIQGVIALENAFNRVGLDHVLLVRVASTAVVTAMLGGSEAQVVNALSNAWIDGGALRTYRHAPNTGSRKSWAAGDAAGRAVRLALMALQGEMGYPSALSAKGWGYYDVLFKGRPFSFSQPYGSYVMENVLFKISFPAEFHAQTAVEAALELHGAVKDRLDDIERIVIETQEAGSRIIDKTGPLDNPADRDHCIQYMVAVPADPRQAHRAGLRGRGRRGSAHRCATREDGGSREPGVHRGLHGSGQAGHRQRGSGALQGRRVHRASGGALPHRPPAAAERGSAAFAEEVRTARRRASGAGPM